MKTVLTSLLLLCAIALHAQNQGVINHQATHFQLPHKGGEIDFIVLDTALTIRKPVFLFCQGSLPMPLFVKSAEYGLYMIGGGVSNFDLKTLCHVYHVVIISMPHTPLVVEEKNLNPQYCYVPDPAAPNAFDPSYIKADYLDNYVSRAQTVLGYLQKQKWVKPSHLVVAGHSQGTKVATKVAVGNKRVTHLGLFAPNPFGRVDQFVREARLDAQLGKITWEEAENRMEANYQYFRDAHDPDSVAAHPEYKTLRSFSESFIDDWLKIKQPIYLAYGTEDRTADLCDLVPLFFIQSGKTNLTFKRYIHLEHNFFEVDAQGKVDYEKAHWPEVMNDFLRWTMK